MHVIDPEQLRMSIYTTVRTMPKSILKGFAGQGRFHENYSAQFAELVVKAVLGSNRRLVEPDRAFGGYPGEWNERDPDPMTLDRSRIIPPPPGTGDAADQLDLQPDAD